MDDLLPPRRVRCHRRPLCALSGMPCEEPDAVSAQFTPALQRRHGRCTSSPAHMMRGAGKASVNGVHLPEASMHLFEREGWKRLALHAQRTREARPNCRRVNDLGLAQCDHRRIPGAPAPKAVGSQRLCANRTDRRPVRGFRRTANAGTRWVSGRRPPSSHALGTP